MKRFVKNFILYFSIAFILVFSGFLFIKGPQYIISFLLPAWSPPAIAVFPSKVNVKKDDCRIALQVEIEDKSYKFLLDTSHPFSVASLERVIFKKNRLVLVEQFFGVGIVDVLKIGGMEFHQVRLPLLGEKKILGHVLSSIPEGFDGILGNDFIFNVNLTLNLKEGSVIMDRPLSRPLEKTYSEMRLKTDLIPLLPEVFAAFKGETVRLQLHSAEENTWIKIKSSLIESDDESPVYLDKIAFTDFEKIEEPFWRKYIGADGFIGCQLLKNFSKVGLDYKAGRIFVVK